MRAQAQVTDVLAGWLGPGPFVSVRFSDGSDVVWHRAPFGVVADIHKWCETSLATEEAA